MASALLQLEQELADRLESIPFFEPYATRGSILVEPRKNIVAEINKKIGQLKTVIVPKVVGADDNHPNVNGVWFDEIRLSVGVIQNPLLASADHAPLEICEEIHKAFKNWTPDSLSNALNPLKPGIQETQSEGLNVFDNNFVTSGGFQGALPQVATPVFTGSNTQVSAASLTCDTPGAAIFYTVDGSKPFPRNSAGYFFAGPWLFAPFAPVTIKARAFLAGYQPSNVVSKTFTTG
jgi:hypothetical protein